MEAVVGYLADWMRRGTDAGDHAARAGESLYALVAAELGDDPALRELTAEAGAGTPSPDTARRLTRALTAAAKADSLFARRLAVQSELYEAARAAGGPARPEDDEAAAGEPVLLADYLRFRDLDAAAVLSARASFARFLDDPEQQPSGFILFHSIVSDCTRTLGEVHPVTRTVRNHSARFLGLTGNPKAPAVAFEALALDCVLLLGPDDLTARAGLARFFQADESPEAVTGVFEALLADCLPVFGPEHAAVRSARDNLTALRSGTANPVAVSGALEAPLADILRILGRDHLVILGARYQLAYLLADEVGPDAGAGVFKALLVDCLRALGSGHELTRRVYDVFGSWLARKYPGQGG